MSVRRHTPRDQVQITKVAISPERRRRRSRTASTEKWARVVQPQSPKTIPGRKSQKPVPFEAPLHFPTDQFPPTDPYAAGLEGKSWYRDPFVRDLPNVTDKDREMIEEYKRRVVAGKVTDEAFWKSVGFKAVGDPSKISAKKKKDYGFGIPKWSPLYTQNVPGQERVVSARTTAAKVLNKAPQRMKSLKPSCLNNTGIPRWSPYQNTGIRISQGTEMGQYGEYVKHDYLVKLSDYLRALAIKSGEDLKMQLDPSFKSLKEAEEKARRKAADEAAAELSRQNSVQNSVEHSEEES